MEREREGEGESENECCTAVLPLLQLLLPYTVTILFGTYLLTHLLIVSSVLVLYLQQQQQPSVAMVKLSSRSGSVSQAGRIELPQTLAQALHLYNGFTIVDVIISSRPHFFYCTLVFRWSQMALHHLLFLCSLPFAGFSSSCFSCFRCCCLTVVKADDCLIPMPAVELAQQRKRGNYQTLEWWW